RVHAHGVVPSVLVERVPARSHVHAGDYSGRRARRDAADAVSDRAATPESRVFERAVFLDRDGTIIEEVGYLDRPERVELFPWTIDAVRVLNRCGLAVVLVSNQSGVARGFFTEEVVDAVHQRMADLLAEGGARIDAYYYCPHHPDGKVPQFAQKCECRKPGRAL